MQRQATDWEEIFRNCVSDIELLSMCKELWKHNNKKINKPI